MSNFVKSFKRLQWTLIVLSADSSPHQPQLGSQSNGHNNRFEQNRTYHTRIRIDKVHYYFVHSLTIYRDMASVEMSSPNNTKSEEPISWTIQVRTTAGKYCL